MEKAKDKTLLDDEMKIPPYFEYGEGNTMAGTLASFGFLEYDEAEQVYRFNGKWVRTIYDHFIWNGEWYRELSNIPGNYSGYPVDLKIIRNSKTNAIEKLMEMNKPETQEALNYRPDWLKKVMDGSEDLTIHMLKLNTEP